MGGAVADMMGRSFYRPPAVAATGQQKGPGEHPGAALRDTYSFGSRLSSSEIVTPTSATPPNAVPVRRFSKLSCACL